MAKTPKPSVVLHIARAHSLDTLRAAAPEVAAKLTHPSTKARVEVEAARPRPIKGRLIPRAEIYSPAFRNAASTAAKTAGFDRTNPETWWSLGVTSETDFLARVRDAYMRSRGDKVPPSKASGNYFEIIGPRNPLVVWFRTTLMGEYRDIVHQLISKDGSFTDGSFQKKVTVHSEFGTKVYTMENPIIVDAGTGTRLDGGEWVDSLDYLRNLHKQCLPIASDMKTAGAAGELTAQVTRHWDRLKAIVAKNPNAVIQGKVNGKPVMLRPDQMVFPTDLEAASYTRLGFRAGTKANTRYDGKVVNDLNGNPYLRFIVYCRTDLMWRFFNALHREMGWETE